MNIASPTHRHLRLMPFVVAIIMLLVCLLVANRASAAQICTPAPHANCAGVNMDGMDLHGLDLTGINFRGASLRAANLNGTNLAGAQLLAGDFAAATFNNANLKKANLTNANFSNAQLRLRICLGQTFMTRISALQIWLTPPSRKRLSLALTSEAPT